jgi:hypothetical protein
MSETEPTTDSSASPKPTPPPAGPRPPWGSDDEFNPEKAWNLLQNVRADLADTKASLEAARQEASELQEFRVKAQEAEESAAETALSLHRERAARVHGLGDEQFEFLAELTDPEAIDARASKLAAMTAKKSEPARPVDMTQGSTAAAKDNTSTAEQFAAAIDGAFTRQ